jgi:hypothetical protein
MRYRAGIPPLAPLALRPLPGGPLGLRHDALAEDATVALDGQALAYQGSRARERAG